MPQPEAVIERGQQLAHREIASGAEDDIVEGLDLLEMFHGRLSDLSNPQTGKKGLGFRPFQAPSRSLPGRFLSRDEPCTTSGERFLQTHAFMKRAHNSVDRPALLTISRAADAVFAQRRRNIAQTT
ncbi:hypothetical protein GCM10007866_19590 [Gluconobacter albidus]|uniref:Uncharacterized protein n=1 Tax=Gluconobacter albidus TaxID=318683 RepID=A0ABQ5X104_9PROT|nr:hypothetical protein GCM10007866_19590 [Gluconobacter albidus]